MDAIRIYFAVALALGGAILTPTRAIAEVNYAPLKASSMLFCPQDHRIYATADPDVKGDLANSLCRINPDTGKIEASVFVGDHPTGIIKSLDGRFLYVLVSDRKMVRQIDRATFKPGSQFSVGQGQMARMIEPIPDLPNAILVLRYDPNISPQGDNLSVFVDGRQATDGVGCGWQLALGVDPARVITSSENSSSDFFCGVNAMLHTDNGGGFFGGMHKALKGSGFGLVLSQDGDVIDPEARQVLGRLPDGGGEICVDPVRPVVYQILTDPSPTLRAYNLRTYRKLWEAALPTWQGTHHLSLPIRWGASGFAYADGDYIVCGNWRFGPASKPVDLKVTRSNFPAHPGPRQQFTYTLTVTNNSDSPSTGAFLTDTIPGVIPILETITSQGTAVYSDGVIRADLGDIPAHGNATLQVKARMDDRGAGGFIAVVRSFDPDPDTSNNIYAGTSYVPHANLGLGAPRPGLKSHWDVLARTATGSGDDLKTRIDGELIVENTGKGTSEPSVVRFYMQDGPSLVIDWAILVQEVQIPSLAPGEQFTASLSATLSLDSDVVGMYVIADVDPLHANGQAVRVGQQIR